MSQSPFRRRPIYVPNPLSPLYFIWALLRSRPSELPLLRHSHSPLQAADCAGSAPRGGGGEVSAGKSVRESRLTTSPRRRSQTGPRTWRGTDGDIQRVREGDGERTCYLSCCVRKSRTSRHALIFLLLRSVIQNTALSSEIPKVDTYLSPKRRGNDLHSHSETHSKSERDSESRATRARAKVPHWLGDQGDKPSSIRARARKTGRERERVREINLRRNAEAAGAGYAGQPINANKCMSASPPQATPLLLLLLPTNERTHVCRVYMHVHARINR